MDLHARALNISPTPRYTRWADHYAEVGGPVLDQVEVLVGFSGATKVMGASAFGRRLSVGVVAGLGLGDDFQPERVPVRYRQVPESYSAIVGAMLEFPVHNNLSAEVDGLYRPLHGSDIPVEANSESRKTRFATLTWQFPVLAKYRFRLAGARPFVELGPSFRAIGNVEIAPPSQYGVTAGAGVELRLKKLKIAPTFRYSRWKSGEFYSSQAHTSANEAQVLTACYF